MSGTEGDAISPQDAFSEGIIALDYKVKGTIDKPDVSVNPGSLLTPGALRNIFNHPEPQQEKSD